MAALAASTPTAEAAPDCDDGLAPAPLAVAVAGGASLGSYQGGYLATLIEGLRDLEGVVTPKVVSGTSAGAINALLAVLQACGSPLEVPVDSRFFELWGAVRFETLFAPDRVRATAALERSGLDDVIAELEQTFDAGLEEGCRLLLGVTATRVRPARISQADGRLRLPRMAAQFLFEVTGRGPGRPPALQNFVGDRDLARPMLPLDGPEADAFGALRDLLLASSAVPLVFEPVPVEHCLGERGRTRCGPEETRTDRFVDGGLFDQNPVRAGADVLLGEDTDPCARPGVLFLIDPFERAYPKPEPEAQAAAPEGALGLAAEIASGFVSAARSQALDTLLRRQPRIEAQLVVSAARHPPYGDLALYFLSFFEDGFRRFDFALGALEARRDLRARRTRAVLAGALEPSAEPTSFDTDADLAAAWPFFRCVAAVLGDRAPAASVEAACAGEEARALPLARVSRERVYDACRPDRLDDADADAGQRALVLRHPDCRRAAEGEAPPGAGARWRRGADEGELAWVLRRLETHGFHFRDLGDTGRAREAFETLRRRAGRVAREFASAQPTSPVLFGALARAAVNALAYRPPRGLLHVAVGPAQEVGLSLAPLSSARWLRLTGALELSGLPTLFNEADTYLGLAPLLGLEAEILPWSGPETQLRLGLRGGWMFSTVDAGGLGDCAASARSARPCSRPVLEAQVSFLVLDLLRLGVQGYYIPRIREGESALLGLRPSIGAQVVLD